MDAVFRVKSSDDAALLTTNIQVGSETDPVYVSSLSSNGDNIARTQPIAQVSLHICQRSLLLLAGQIPNTFEPPHLVCSYGTGGVDSNLKLR